MAELIRPIFRKAFHGYNKAEVNQYITRIESEVEIARLQQEKREREIVELRAAERSLQTKLENALADLESEKNKNEILTSSIQDLETQLNDHTDALRKANQQIQELRDAAAESDHDPQTIRDAILSAQRMGTIIVCEANQRADAIRSQAESEYSQTQLALQQQTEETNQHIDQMLADAKEKCNQLQMDYDRILMDVSGFKAEMIAMYRRHLELLYKLPDNTNGNNMEYIDSEAAVTV